MSDEFGRVIEQQRRRASERPRSCPALPAVAMLAGLGCWAACSAVLFGAALIVEALR